MAHRRNIASEMLPEGAALTRAAAGIGMRFAVEPERNANIEDTLLAASVEGMERDDLRLLAVLVTWLDVHSPWLNADRLVRLVAQAESQRVRALWAAIAAWKSSDQRLRRLSKLHRGLPVPLLRAGSKFQLARSGEDPRFTGTALEVPAQVLRARPADVLSTAELARQHAAYRWRVIIGPTYRADMWAELERRPALSAAELARRCYGSFSTAWHVRRDRAALTS